ncbi:pilus assembly protein [Lutimaribacter sp. EGI FJ00015]|uniref:TadE/TadG family type IV pilus assembly protein n=1 Tax=Lutimaribacter degradans TaxID=2945989 RepID=UPI00203B9DEB|nr:TadE/TadG family type IV pilus assembly protein [Lutimaribacter sp. EGI FJ00013]MCO0614565.1 pilus assembly protein [Lutimaribacter sp. EGI FJ00015]
MVSRFIKDQDGVVAVIFALLLPVIIGAIVLGVETGLWLMHRAKLQHIADTAAYSAAIRYSSGATEAQALATANAVADQAGFDAVLGDVVMTLPDTDRLSVTVTRNQGRMFSAIFLDEDVVIRAQATAQFGEAGPPLRATCMQSLNNGWFSSEAFELGAQSSLTLPDFCDVRVNSTDRRAFSMVGGTTLTAGCLQVAGGARINGTLNLAQCAAEETETGVDYPDPFVSLPEPAAVGTCQPRDVGTRNGVTRLTPTEPHPSGERVMRFCNGLELSGTVIFDPGLYIIEGGVMEASRFGAQVSTPGGATFFFRDFGAPDFRDDFDGTLTPSQSGPWADVLIFGTGRLFGLINQNFYFEDDDLTGVVYAPDATVNFERRSDNRGCFQVVSDRLLLENGASVTMDCEGSSFTPGGGTPGGGGGAGDVMLVE